MAKQLQSPVKQLLEVESANGPTQYWNQYGFPKMKSQKSLKSVTTKLLFLWYGYLQAYLGFHIEFLFQSPPTCELLFVLLRYAIMSLPTNLILQGSTKTGILGEIFLNLVNFLNLVDPTAISMPLKRCNSGTVLQVG